jgi:hypothetical protein
MNGSVIKAILGVIATVWMLRGTGILPKLTYQMAVMAADAQRHQFSMLAYNKMLTGQRKAHHGHN